jgi:hypothetical protein
MWGKKAKRDKADEAFSLYIRTRDGWRCARCKRYFGENHGLLDCSHYWGRVKEGTRFDPDNCDALCKGCHEIWGHGDVRYLYEEFKKKQLGEAGFKALMVRAHSYCKKDRAMALLVAKALLRELEERKAA